MDLLKRTCEYLTEQQLIPADKLDDFNEAVGEISWPVVQGLLSVYVWPYKGREEVCLKHLMKLVVDTCLERGIDPPILKKKHGRYLIGLLVEANGL
jgi:hypothetical protein